MKIAIPSDSQQGIGGGWSFKRNLTKGLQLIGQEVIDNPLQADIVLISGVTMVGKETVRTIKEKGVKMIVRLDNVPRNSRNRNTGTSRMKSFSRMAEEVIWQGEWTKWYLKDFVGREGKIVYNGTDLDIFKSCCDGKDSKCYNHFVFDGRGRDNYYLYSRFSRDETKMWEVAWYKYQLIQRQNKEAKLMILGKFSPENLQWDFDFFRGENFEYLGVIEDLLHLAKVLRSCRYLLATYFNDAFSNTYLEALVSGMELYEPDLSGGTEEMLQLFKQRGREYFSLQRMAEDYLKVFEKVVHG